MHPEIVIIPVMVVIPAIVIVVRMGLRHVEKMASLKQPPQSTSGVEARLERVEQALDAIAVEMERVGESQRFLTRLLAEKPAALSDGAEIKRGRTITPH